MGEVQLAALLCAFLAGSEQETRHYFDVHGQKRHVRVDCETERHVFEIGLDGTESSRDSVHQALFFAHLTGKVPAVILIDRDGYEGRFEYEMRKVTAAAGVAYARCTKDVILRWASSAPMRRTMRRTPGDGLADDLPREGNASTSCDLSGLLAPPGAS